MSEDFGSGILANCILSKDLITFFLLMFGDVVKNLRNAIFSLFWIWSFGSNGGKFSLFFSIAFLFSFIFVGGKERVVDLFWGLMLLFKFVLLCFHQ